MEKTKKIPVGIKVISVLYYIGAVLSIIGAAMFIFSGAYAVPGLVGGGMLMGLGAFAVIIFLAFGALGFFIGRDLWRLKAWARIAVLVISGLGVISAVTGEFNLIGLLINLLVGWYVGFHKEVLDAFNAKPLFETGGSKSGGQGDSHSEMNQGDQEVHDTVMDDEEPSE